MSFPSESIVLEAAELCALAHLGGGAKGALEAIGLDVLPNNDPELLRNGARSLHERGGVDGGDDGVHVSPCLAAVSDALQQRPMYLGLQSRDDVEAVWILHVSDRICVSLQMLNPLVFVARAVECSPEELGRRLAESFLAENEPRVVSFGTCDGAEVSLQRVVRSMPDGALLMHNAPDDRGRRIERHELIDELIRESC